MLQEVILTPYQVYFSRNPDFIFRKVLDEFILVPIHKDVADMECIYTLNPLGAFIWEKLEKPLSVAALLAAIADRYDADPQLIRMDLENFLEELGAIGALGTLQET